MKLEMETNGGMVLLLAWFGSVHVRLRMFLLKNKSRHALGMSSACLCLRHALKDTCITFCPLA